MRPFPDSRESRRPRKSHRAERCRWRYERRVAQETAIGLRQSRAEPVPFPDTGAMLARCTNSSDHHAQRRCHHAAQIPEFRESRQNLAQPQTIRTPWQYLRIQRARGRPDPSCLPQARRA